MNGACGRVLGTALHLSSTGPMRQRSRPSSSPQLPGDLEKNIQSFPGWKKPDPPKTGPVREGTVSGGKAEGNKDPCLQEETPRQREVSRDRICTKWNSHLCMATRFSSHGVCCVGSHGAVISVWCLPVRAVPSTEQVLSKCLPSK